MIRIANDRKHLLYLGFTEYHIRNKSGQGNTQEQVQNFLQNASKGYYNMFHNYPDLVVSVRSPAETQLMLRYGDFISEIIKPHKERVNE